MVVFKPFACPILASRKYTPHMGGGPTRKEQHPNQADSNIGGCCKNKKESPQIYTSYMPSDCNLLDDIKKTCAQSIVYMGQVFFRINLIFS